MSSFPAHVDHPCFFLPVPATIYYFTELSPRCVSFCCTSYVILFFQDRIILYTLHYPSIFVSLLRRVVILRIIRGVAIGLMIGSHCAFSQYAKIVGQGQHEPQLCCWLGCLGLVSALSCKDAGVQGEVGLRFVYD